MIRVDLSASEVPIEPGGTAQLEVTLSGAIDSADQVALEIEGIDMEWYAIPVSTVAVEPGGKGATRVLFKVSRSSEAHAGTYPFVVRATGMETGDTGVAQASLVVKPYSSLQIDMSPKRAVSSFFNRSNLFDVSVTNLGNKPETLDLFARDPEDACAYEFETDRVTVAPGHTSSVPLVVEPVTRPILGSTRLFGFAVTTRSISDAYVSAASQGQVERRALLSTVTLIVAMVLTLAGGLAYWLQPKPVEVRSFTATPMQITAGEQVTLSWDVANFSASSYISPGNVRLNSGVDSAVVTPAETTTYKLIARGGGSEVTKEIVVVVTAQPSPARAKILQFGVSSTRIHQGDSVTLTWKVQGVSQMVLNPLGKALDPALYTSHEVKPDQSTTYELTVQGKGLDSVSKTVKVEVVGPLVSLAQIKGFRAKPEQIVTGESAVLSWTVANAETVDIDNGPGSVKPAGTASVQPMQTTTYTLRAQDSKGNAETRSVTIKVVEPPPMEQPIDEPVTTPPSPGR